jgi:hypothetical protein
MRRIALIGALVSLLALIGFGGGTASAELRTGKKFNSMREMISQIGLGPATTPGPAEHFGIFSTECPHAGEPSDHNPKPLDRVPDDKVEQLSNGGDDVRVNQDYACMPQNETSIAVNPTNPKNVVAGQNDYQIGWGTSGFDVSTDNGNHWDNRIRPFPTSGTPLLAPLVLGDDHLDGGGDPAIAFDRDGVVYYADIHFEREREDNGIFVSRSTNGGFTWSRPCIVRTQNARCGGTGDPRPPGDGVVVFDEDVDGTGPLPSPAFNDKEYIAVGPRPAGVEPVCFSAGFVERTTGPGPVGRIGSIIGKQEVECTIVGSDRIYVTWTRFDSLNALEAAAYISWSDDQGRSWSPPQKINGSDANFCKVAVPPTECNSNQFTSPTVNPKTGFLYIGWENFNTVEENQYLVVRSHDGGQTFEGPFFATWIFDLNYPDAGDERPDCTQRGQQGGRNVLTNSCFRIFSAANMAADKRGPSTSPPCVPDADDPARCDLGFADDLYMVLSDNRNGTERSTNTDVFLFKSTDGGMTWIGPTRVNNDPSTEPVDRNCQIEDEEVLLGATRCPATHTGNDNYYPWVDVSLKGDVNVGFYDRRLDTNSTLGEYPGSREPPQGRPGNYLAWYWGAICTITTTAKVTEGATTVPAAASQCLAPDADIIVPPGPTDISPPDEPFGTTFLGPFKNFTLSDVPQNDDYAFRGGIFSGDYSNVAIGPDGTAYAFWTDARNGRGSGNNPSQVSQQEGRNPSCEQSDVFMDSYSSNSGGTAKQPPSLDVINAFSVTPCPPGMLVTP